MSNGMVYVIIVWRIKKTVSILLLIESGQKMSGQRENKGESVQNKKVLNIYIFVYFIEKLVLGA